MARGLRVLCSGLVTGIAICAVMGPVAQASNFASAKYPATISTEQVQTNVFKISAGSLKCQIINLSGTLTAASPTLSLVPEYKSCLLSGLVPATINVNSCEYLFHAGEGAGNVWSGTTDVVCPAGKQIEVGFGELSNCKIDIGSQSGIGGLTFNNNNPKLGEVSTALNMSGIKYTLTGKPKTCGLSQTVENEVRVDGTYEGSVRARGNNGFVGVGLEFPLPAGEFTSAAYPATISGQQVQQHGFGSKAGLLSCKRVEFDGSLGSASSTLALASLYAECVLSGGVKTIVNRNGCDYRFHADEGVGLIWGGTMDVVCSSPSEQIEIIVGEAGACKIDIGEQSGVEGVAFTDNSPSVGEITIALNMSGIKYTLTGKPKACAASQTVENEVRADGTYTGSVAAGGSNGAVLVD